MHTLANTTAVEETDKKPISGNHLARNEMHFHRRLQCLAVLSIKEASKHLSSSIPMPTFLFIAPAHPVPWELEPKYHNICTSKIIPTHISKCELQFGKGNKTLNNVQLFNPKVLLLENIVRKYHETWTDCMQCYLQTSEQETIRCPILWH